MTTKLRETPTIRKAILELLSDGVERSSLQIVTELEAKYGFHKPSVAVELSYTANIRQIERRRGERSRYLYRFNAAA